MSTQSQQHNSAKDIPTNVTTPVVRQQPKRPPQTLAHGDTKRQKTYDFAKDETTDRLQDIGSKTFTPSDTIDTTATPIMSAKRQEDMKTQRLTDNVTAAPRTQK